MIIHCCGKATLVSEKFFFWQISQFNAKLALVFIFVPTAFPLAHQVWQPASFACPKWTISQAIYQIWRIPVLPGLRLTIFFSYSIAPNNILPHLCEAPPMAVTWGASHPLLTLLTAPAPLTLLTLTAHVGCLSSPSDPAHRTDRRSPGRLAVRVIANVEHTHKTKQNNLTESYLTLMSDDFQHFLNFDFV